MLNFLTFDTAYCLYPRATIVEKKSLLLKDIEDVKPGVRAAVRKYRRRGFTFIQLAEENDEELFHLKKVLLGVLIYRNFLNHTDYSRTIAVLPRVQVGLSQHTLTTIIGCAVICGTMILAFFPFCMRLYGSEACSWICW